MIMKMFKVLCLFVVALVNPILAMLFLLFPKMQNIFNPVVFLIIIGSFIPGLVFILSQNSDPDFWYRFFNSVFGLMISVSVVALLIGGVIHLVVKRNKANKMKNLRHHP